MIRDRANDNGTLQLKVATRGRGRMSAALGPGSRAAKFLRVSAIRAAPQPHILYSASNDCPNLATNSARLELVARRVRAGWPLFQALDSVARSQPALARRCGVSSRVMWNWRHYYIPESRREEIALALGVPVSLIVAGDDVKLQICGELIRQGKPFAEALRICRGGSALARRIGVQKDVPKNWILRGIPQHRLYAVAAAVGCAVELLPRGRTRSEAMREVAPRRHVNLAGQRAMIETMRSPKMRAHFAAIAKKQPRVNGRFVRRFRGGYDG